MKTEMDPNANALPFRRIGNYRLVRKLGEGGMGEVYLAVEEPIDRKVAIKLMRSGLDADYLRRFNDERKALAALNQRNVVTIFASGEASGRHYFVMEYLDGESLRERIRRGLIPLMEIAEITRQICAALTAAHNRHIVHRDIKPENIFLSRDDDGLLVKVLDFGIATLKESEARTVTNAILGTMAYLSPEQVLGLNRKEIDGRADIYTLGVVVYEMLTGVLPFTASNGAAYLHQHLNVTPRPPSDRESGTAITKAVDYVVMKALAKDRNYRHQTAQEFARSLKEAIEERLVTPVMYSASGVNPAHLTLKKAILFPIYPLFFGITLLARLGKAVLETLLYLRNSLSGSDPEAGSRQLSQVKQTPIAARKEPNFQPQTSLRQDQAVSIGQRDHDSQPESVSAIVLGKHTINLKLRDGAATIDRKNESRTAVIRHTEFFHKKHWHITEDLVLHKDFERISRWLARANGQKILMTGYGRFGATSLLKCAIAKSQSIIDRKKQAEIVILVFYFEMVSESKDAFYMKADDFLLNGIDSDGVAYAFMNEEYIDVMPSVDKSFVRVKLNEPIGNSFFFHRQTSRYGSPFETGYNLSRMSVDLRNCLERNEGNESIFSIVERAIDSRSMQTRIVVVIDRIKYLSTFESVSRSPLLGNDKTTVIAIARMEDRNSWGNAEESIRTAAFIEWYIPSLWEIIWDDLIVRPQSAEMNQKYTSFLKHLEYKVRGSFGNLDTEFNSPPYIHYDNNSSFIDISDVSSKPEVLHNAWLQDLLSLNWEYLLNNLFAGPNQQMREDRARNGIYLLMDWIGSKAFDQKISRKEILEHSKTFFITISDDAETRLTVINKLLRLLTAAGYLRVSKGKYRGVWDKNNQPKCIKIVADEEGDGAQATQTERSGRLANDNDFSFPRRAEEDAPMDSGQASSELVADDPLATAVFLDKSLAVNTEIPIITEKGENALGVAKSTSTSISPSAKNAQRAKIFISYSHKDLKWLKQLKPHLKYFEQLGIIDLWDDTKIVPGAAWKEEIEMAVNTAKIALLLVSADFLTSDFITSHELPPLLTSSRRKGTIIIPVIVRHCLFSESNLSQFQSFNNPSNPLSDMTSNQREMLFVELARTIKDALES